MVSVEYYIFDYEKNQSNLKYLHENIGVLIVNPTVRVTQTALPLY